MSAVHVKYKLIAFFPADAARDIVRHVSKIQFKPKVARERKHVHGGRVPIFFDNRKIVLDRHALSPILSAGDPPVVVSLPAGGTGFKNSRYPLTRAGASS